MLDNSGYIHYYLIIENLPEDISKNIKFGKASGKSYNDYVAGKDLFGVTDDLKVYYSDAKGQMYNASGIEFSKEKGSSPVFAKGSALAKLVNGKDSNDGVNVSQARNLGEIEINSDSEISNLNEFYNFTSLRTLTLNNVTMSTLEGIEYATEVEEIIIIKSTINNYSNIANLKKLKYLLVEDPTDDEVKKICDKTTGIGGKDISTLKQLGFYGERHFEYRFTNDALRDTSHYSTFSNISYLDNLSKATKESIEYLFLNSNSLTSLDNLYKFKNVKILRLEGNQITTLNGIYDEESGKYMSSLEKLFLRRNLLGKDLEGSAINPGVDSLSQLATTIEDSSTGEYSFEFRFSTLRVLDLAANGYLKWLDYLGESSLYGLHLNACTNLNTSSLLNIASLINSISPTNFALEQVYKDFLAENDLNTTSIELNDKQMTVFDFLAKLKNRNKVENLNLSNLILVDNNNPTSQVSSEVFTETINNVLDNLSTLKCVNFYGLSKLTSIAKIEKNTDLKVLDLKGTGITDLKVLDDNCTKIVYLRIDNAGIKLSDIQNVINRAYIGRPSSVGAYAKGCGIILGSQALRNQLLECTKVTAFSCYDETQDTWDKNAVWPFQNTKISDKFFICYCDGKFSLPATCTYFNFQPKYYSNKTDGNVDTSTVVTIENQADLVNLKTIKSNWANNIDNINAVSSGLPALEKIDFYGNGSILFVNDILNKNIKELHIYGYSGNATTGSLSMENLAGIGEFTNLTKLFFMHEKKLTSLPQEISSCNKLFSICLNETGITNLYAIRNMSCIGELNLSNTPLKETGFFEDDTTTEPISANNMEILRNLNKTYSGNVNKLISLSAQNCGVTDWSLLENLTWAWFSH